MYSSTSLISEGQQPICAKKNMLLLSESNLSVANKEGQDVVLPSLAYRETW